MEALPAIEQAGGRLVLVTPQPAARAASWRDELRLSDALVIADPERSLYRAVRARRPTPLWVLRPRVWMTGLRALAAGGRSTWTRGDDALQLGADVIVDRDGRIAFLHLASDAADRVPPAELVAVLQRLEPASALTPTPSAA